MKRFLSLVAVAALAAIPLVMSGGSASAVPARTFTVTPNPVVAGNTVTFSGTGCVPEPGDPAGYPRVTVAFVDTSGDPATSAAMSSAGTSVGPARTGTAWLSARSGVKAFAADDGGDGTTTPKADGTWSESLDVPDYVVGDFPFGAVCDHYTDSFSYEPVTLTVQINPNDPVLIVLPDFANDDPASVPELSTGVGYEVAGIGFAPGENVQLVLHSAPVVLITLTADDTYGAVDGTFKLPDNTVGGAHTLTAVGLTSGKSGSLPITVRADPVTTVTATTIATVTASAPVTSTSSTTAAAAVATTTTAGPTLAATGTPASQLGWLGLVLTLLGATTLLFARRRSPRIH